MLPSAPSSIKVEIIKPELADWQKFTNYEEPSLVINNKSYQVQTGGVAGFARATGTLINNSQFDFETILVKVILRGSSGELLALSHQTMNTVRAREQRDFNIIFPHSFPGQVQTVEVEPEVNVFASDNYIRIQGRPEVWDQGQ